MFYSFHLAAITFFEIFSVNAVAFRFNPYHSYRSLKTHKHIFARSLNAKT
jgi:hypothetical protein